MQKLTNLGHSLFVAKISLDGGEIGLSSAKAVTNSTRAKALSPLTIVPISEVAKFFSRINQ